MRNPAAVSTTTTLATILLLPMLGCAGIPKNESALDLYQGRYSFEGLISRYEIDGQISFEGDMYHMSSNVGACSGRMTERLQRPPRQRARFDCAGMTVNFHVAGNELGSDAQVTMRIPEGTRTRTVCRIWRQDKNGKRVCQQYGTSIETIYATRRGTLTVARVDTDDS